MAFDYTNLENVAERLISDFGQSGVLKIKDAGTEPWETGNTFTEVNIIAVKLGITDEDRNKLQNTVDYSEIAKFYIVGKGLNTEPSPNMIINYENQDWMIQSSQKVQPRSKKIYYQAIATI